MRYLIVIPAFNEEENIGAVINTTQHTIPFADILIINDGSTDKTPVRATERGIKVINHPFNLGYGAALQTGFRFAVTRGYDFVITMDADGQHVSSFVNNLIEAMHEQQADVVIGSRFLKGDYRVSLVKKIGIWLFSLIGKTYTGLKITDPTSGFQLLNRRAFSYLSEGDNYPLDYPDVNIIMALHKMRFKVVESPVTMLENMSGQSMHSGLKPVLYVMKMFLAIVMVWVRRKGK